MSSVAVISAVLSMLAGIGIFLVACSMMSSNLEAVSSGRLRSLFKKVSGNKLIGVGIGAVTTAAIQSSGATTVMIIGFVNYIITLVLKKTGLSGTDRMLGTVFGAIRGCLIVLIAACGLSLAFNYGFFTKLKSEPWFNDAKILPEVLHLADSTLKSFGLENLGKSMVTGYAAKNETVEQKAEEAPVAEKAEGAPAADAGVTVEEEKLD